MKLLADVSEVYLHREAVDFRKSINGLVLIVEQEMALSPFADALFVFCNKSRDKLKLVYWDQTGSRPGKSQHDALDALYVAISQRKVSYVLDADIKGFYDHIDQGQPLI